MARILVVEDDAQKGRLVADGLRADGYDVTVVGNGVDAMIAVANESFAAAAIDVMLPEMTGFEICRHLRRQGSTLPVLLLTARDAVEDLWDELREIAAARGVTLYTMVGHRASIGPAWMSAGDAERGVRLDSAFPDLADSDLYVCGPAAWLDAVVADAHAHGVPEHRVHAERFDW